MHAYTIYIYIYYLYATIMVSSLRLNPLCVKCQMKAIYDLSLRSSYVTDHFLLKVILVRSFQLKLF